MNISDASQASGLPNKTIRYYETIGLVAPARTANGYRDFSDADTERLTFLARARGLGFSIEECRALLSLYNDTARSSAEVKRLANGHLARIDDRIAQMQALRGTLQALLARCQGDDGPDCAILDSLAGGGPVRA
ncbi:MAG: Cu(I)-responsive transcriptional regulator [Pseudomonadota bacterium]